MGVGGIGPVLGGGLAQKGPILADPSETLGRFWRFLAKIGPILGPFSGVPDFRGSRAMPGIGRSRGLERPSKKDVAADRVDFGLKFGPKIDVAATSFFGGCF